MTRLLTTGFETGTSHDVISGGYTIDGSVVKTGGYSLRMTNDNIGQLRQFANSSELYVGFAWRIANASANAKVVQFLDGATIVLTLYFNAANGKIHAYTGDASSLLASGTTVIATAFWYYVEVHIKIADASGDFEVKLDGVSEIDYSGDTKPSTNTTANNIQFRGGGGGSSNWSYIDDVVVNDVNGAANNTWPGQIRLQPIRPNAAGDSAQFTRGGTDRGANWDQVDEVPSVHTDYIYSTTVDHKELYNAGTFTVPTGATVKNLVVVAVAGLDSGAGNLTVGVKSTTEDFNSVDTALGVAFKTVEYAVPLDPATGSAWAQSGIDGVQLGVKCR
jgi:hypothetical protein